jgi:integrase
MVPNGFKPAKEMERRKVGHQEVKFLSVADLRKVLAGVQAKRPDLIPLVALVCFVGLRPSEADRLDWNEVGKDYICLPGSKSKTGYSRQIPIQPNLQAWLAPWRRSEGLICPDVCLEHVNTGILYASGVKMPHDGMRHGYGTYRQAIVKNVGAVASEMGNTPQVCRRHDLNAFCTEEEAKVWFSIMPDAPANIIGLPQAQAAPAPEQVQEAAAS